MKRLLLLLLLATSGCISNNTVIEQPAEPDPIPDVSPFEFSLPGLARMFAELPIDARHLQEVFDAVGSSTGNGYDEEYTMKCLMNTPGAGVGEHGKGTRADNYSNPLRDLIRDYYGSKAPTRATVDEMMDRLAESDYQLYWPYSENWDGETFPIITYDPGYGAESGYGYEITAGPGGERTVNQVYVDEAVAKKRPVWVLNSNSDASFTPLEMFVKQHLSGSTAPDTAPCSRPRRLMLKSLTMLRNYDSWFGGASEFWVKCGSVDGFSASTEAELKQFSPSVTDFIVVVQRRYVGKELPFEAILVSDFSNQLDKLAFLITEDDGGTRTSWKSEVSVKIASKSYGFTIDIPYNEKDDIVWRGPLSARYFEEEDVVTGRFGDVIVSFELE